MNTASQCRFHVTTYHGEGATVWHVMDRETGDCVARFSTQKYASRAHSMAVFCRDTHNQRSCRCESTR